MIDSIKSALQAEGVAVWRITETRTKAAELYYIKKQLDMPRVKDMLEYSVEVFRDFEEDGVRYRGVTTALVSPGMSGDEVRERVRGAYFAAAYVKNPWYELPEAVQCAHVPSESDLAATEPQRAVRQMAEALFSADIDRDAFINSAELFATRSSVHLLASNGLDVSYDADRVTGELVAQCVAPRDVEQYRSLSYDRLDTAALTEKVRSAISDVRQRARASEAPKAGRYDLLLTGENLREVLDYYLTRSNASMIYPHYSTWAVGTPVQGETVTGEALNLSLVADRPFSEEGIPMSTRTLVEDGVLKLLHGNTRFCRYLGVEPTGAYRKLRCDNGTESIETLRGPGVLEAVSFSDFQMDAFSGHFGGEIRLALLHDGSGTLPLTGGSVNGNLAEAQGQLIFSRERCRDGDYEGPLAVLIPGVMVAGD